MITSVKMKKIARTAAKIAAVQTYRAITNGTLTKKASTGSRVTTKDIAKVAATATYQAILSFAQQAPAPDSFAVFAKIRALLKAVGVEVGSVDNQGQGGIIIVNVTDPAKLQTAATVLRQNAAVFKSMGYTKPSITIYSEGYNNAQSVPMS